MKKFTTLLVFCFAFIAFRSQPLASSFVIKDMTGRNVFIKERPKRIICLGPGALRLIVYLGAAKKVVGVEDIEKRFPDSRPYWMANRRLWKLPSVGPGGPQAINNMPDLEAVLKTMPDIIFVTYMEKNKADELQERLGVPVVVLSYGEEGTINEKIYQSLRLAGKVLFLEHRAKEVISFIEKSRNYLLSAIQKHPKIQKPTVYAACIGYRGLHGIGSTEANYIPFEWVRAKNVAKAIKDHGHVFVSREKVLFWDPQIIFVDSGGLSLLKQDYVRKRNFYNSLTAFKDRKVYVLYPYNWYATNIGTAICDAYAVAKVLYPGVFKNLDLEKKINEIYSFMVGRALYQEMKNTYGVILRKPSFLD